MLRMYFHREIAMPCLTFQMGAQEDDPNLPAVKVS